jgi:pyruvate dehydrogenase E2 component (dihydrolipoamide acetyltransferase)
MIVEIAMPRLSDSMEEGTIVTWLKEDGEVVAIGDDLVEIETDKATMTYEAEVEGVLSIVAATGDTLPVGALIARVADEPANASLARPSATLAAPPATAAGSPTPSAPVADPRATPLARRVAAVHGIALAAITGSGPRGRITRNDVRAAGGLSQEPRPAARQRAAVEPRSDSTEVVRPSRLQQTIARRMSEAKASIPHFQVQTEAVVDDLIALRARLKQAAHGEPAPSLNDFVIKACALSLPEHPRANGSYRDETFVLHRAVNVGFAVAAEEALVVPLVRDANEKSVGQIARETRQLAERVRSQDMAPSELSDGTFTVSNLGMFGMSAIVPVVNPPQSAILGVGALRPVLARDGDVIVDRRVMTLTLSCDHRILYGAEAARFLACVKEMLEAPLRLAL